MDYKRPEDINIDVIPTSQEEFEILLSEENRENIKANFREVAFRIFTLLDNWCYEIGDFEIVADDNYVNENYKLYYFDKCIFELRGSTQSDMWLAFAYCLPETAVLFCRLVDIEFNVGYIINTEPWSYSQEFEDSDSRSGTWSYNQKSDNSNNRPYFDKTKDIFGRPLKEGYPGLFWLGMSAEEEENVCNEYWAMIDHVDKNIFHRK